MSRVAIAIGALVVAVAGIVALGVRLSDDETASAPSATSTTAARTTSTTTAEAPAPDPAVSPPATPSTAPPPGDDAALPSDLAAVTSPWPTDWTVRTIELDELKIGIPVFDPRDRISPLDEPAYESIESAGDWLVDREIGVLVDLGDVARFYPLRILTSHEVVNDEVDDLPFVVTYCPLCNTAVAFDRRVNGEVLRFGVSGLLRNSDLVMWDDQTVSLWQQITGEGIVGAFAGTRLTVLPTATVRWADFKAVHPDGEVLSQDTGFGFNYGSNSYVGYSQRAAPFGSFFDQPVDDRFPALSRVVGVRVGDATKAYPFSVIDDERAVNDELAGTPIAVWWAPTDSADNFIGERVGEGDAIGTGIAFLRDVDGQVLSFEPAGDDTFVDLETGSTWDLFGEATGGLLAGAQLELALHQNEFWFAWSAFNPDSPVYGASGS